MKHSTLIKNNEVSFITTTGLQEFGGTQNFWRQKGDNTKIFSLKMGEQKIFIKRIF